MFKSLRKWIRDAFDEQGKREEAWKAAEAKADAHLRGIEERVRKRLTTTLCLPLPLRGKRRRARSWIGGDDSVSANMYPALKPLSPKEQRELQKFEGS